jgi:hypothetical protein
MACQVLESKMRNIIKEFVFEASAFFALTLSMVFLWDHGEILIVVYAIICNCLFFLLDRRSYND